MLNVGKLAMLVFPAPAGVIPALYTGERIRVCFPRTWGVIRYDGFSIQSSYRFPRTCGGDPDDNERYIKAFEFSPHLRG